LASSTETRQGVRMALAKKLKGCLGRYRAAGDDASLVVAAETLRTRKIFTIDRGDFSTYRINRG
jgi:predicted nucleic acid-binding protein